MANKWLEHLKKFRAENPNIEFAQMAKEAKKTYSPVKKTGEAPAVVAVAPPSARKTRRGRKGRGTRKSRRHH